MITDLYRYPVKGLSGVALQSVELIAEKGIAGDRAIAIARNEGILQLSSLQGLAKNHFLMLMRDEALALLDCKYSEDTDELTISRDGKELLKGAVNNHDDRQNIEDFFRKFLGDPSLDPTLAYAEETKFTDIGRLSYAKMNAVSLINLNSIRALEAEIDQEVDPRRFRANIYFDGVPAWEEFEWVDKSISIGTAKARAVMRTTRCAATQVNPDNATRDINVPQDIRRHFGHSDMGIYAQITATGEISVGDPTVAMID